MDDPCDCILEMLLDVGLSDGWQGAERAVTDRILAIPEIVEWREKAERWDRACMDALDD